MAATTQTVPPARRHRPGPPARSAKPVLAALGVLAFLAAVFGYYLLARSVWGGNSDAATLVLQAQSIAHGNVMLHGWAFLLDPFWTVDVPLYTLGYLFVGLDPGLMFWIPAIAAALVLVVGVRIATAGRSRRAAWISAVTLVALIGLPTGAWSFLFLSIYGHITTALLCLVAFVALGARGFGWRWGVAVALLALGLVGDLQTLVMGVGPLAGAAVVTMLRARSVRPGVPTLAAAVAAPILGYALRGIGVAIGTYQVGATNPHASRAEIRANILRLPRYLLHTFGYDRARSQLFGVAVPLDTVRLVAAAVVVLAVAAGLAAMVWDVLRGPRTGREQPVTVAWRVDDVLLIAAAVDLVFFMYATLANDMSYMRYLVPFVLFGSIFTARHTGPVILGIRNRIASRGLIAAGGLLVIVFAATSLSGLRADAAPNRYGPLATFLAAHGLHRGVGDFWHANDITVASGGAVVVRPVQGVDGRIVRREQLAQDAWYGVGFQFVLCRPVDAFEQVSCDVALSTFGPPAHRYQVEDVDVLVWSGPITVPR